MKRCLAAIAAATAAALALALTGCGDSHEPGPAGTVTAKDTDRDCRTTGTGKKRHQSCDTDYELTVRTEDGDQVEFDVARSDYDDCHRGSAYPKCTKH